MTGAIGDSPWIVGVACQILVQGKDAIWNSFFCARRFYSRTDYE